MKIIMTNKANHTRPEITNEIKVMREFLMEFNPFYADEKILDDMNYDELVEAMRETLKEM